MTRKEEEDLLIGRCESRPEAGYSLGFELRSSMKKGGFLTESRYHSYCGCDSYTIRSNQQPHGLNVGVFIEYGCVVDKRVPMPEKWGFAESWRLSAQLAPGQRLQSNQVR